MITSSDLLHLPYTRDLTEGGIVYALHSLPYVYHRMSDSPYDLLRRVVASTAVEIAFRRYLSEQNIPFEVKAVAPFTEHQGYDVMLAGQRCEVMSFLITDREQMAQIKDSPERLLRAPALVASDQHAGEEYSARDNYLFAFLPGLITTTGQDLQTVIETGQSHYLIHVMPDGWRRPSQWTPLGKLALKTDSEDGITIEIGGQDERREMRTYTIELPPRMRVQIQDNLFSLCYVHSRSNPQARIGIHSPIRKQTYLIDRPDWGNIWVEGMDVLLAGYITRDEFRRRAHFIQAGSRIFPYEVVQVKNLAVPVSELKPLSELFQRAKPFSTQLTS